MPKPQGEPHDAVPQEPAQRPQLGVIEGGHADTPVPRSPARRPAPVVARAVVAFVLLSMLVTNIWLIYQVRAQEIERAATQTANLARVAGAQLDHVIAEADRILDIVGHGLGQTTMGPGLTAQVQSLFRHYMQSATVVRGIYVHDAHGDLVASSMPGFTLNIAQRDYFIRHQTGLSNKTVFNPPVKGRATGEWIVPITRRITNRAGQFAGVVVVTVSIQHLRSQLAAIDTDASAQFTLILADRIVLRLPFQESQIGLALPADTLPPWARTQPAGTFERVTDEMQMVYSFRRVNDYPIVVLAGVRKSAALHKWRRDATVQALWLLLLGGMLAISAVSVRRSHAQRQAAEIGLLQTRDALARANRELARLAQYDGLTGLANRRHFDERLDRVFRQAQRNRLALAIVMVDVDEFKKYNDRYGHVEGDACLRRIAQALASVLLRPEDFIARYGGEEIVLLLPETDLAGAVAVAESARLAVLALGIAHDASALGTVSVSLGVAAGVPWVASPPDQLLRRADAALYRAKGAGRNMVWPSPRPKAGAAEP